MVVNLNDHCMHIVLSAYFFTSCLISIKYCCYRSVAGLETAGNCLLPLLKVGRRWKILLVLKMEGFVGVNQTTVTLARRARGGLKSGFSFCLE